MTTQITCAVIMDDITKINKKKDSSLAIIEAIIKKKWQVIYIREQDLYYSAGPKACGRFVAVNDNLDISLSSEQTFDLTSLNAIFMRLDPPFDSEYLYATFILDKAEQAGVLVVNKPQSLRDFNEKFFATNFAHLMPQTIISRRLDILKEFVNTHQDVILKPLDGMGGSRIFRHRAGDPNLSVILETLTIDESQQIMIQKYIPEIIDGDKRILITSGKVVPYCLARIPQTGETRGNLAAGGSGVAQPLSESDWQIANEIAPVLLEKGIYLAGIDVIGSYLTEINITSPTCMREINKAFNTDIAGDLINLLEPLIVK